MCGIAGIVGGAPDTGEANVRAALDCIVHRGPDGEGVYAANGVVLGMRRLSIIDLEHGDQPIFDETGDVAVVCNGELYDYVEHFAALRGRGHTLQSASDVNVLPHLYQERGVDCFAAVRGMFAAALWDRRERRLVLARDAVGKKPLFWARRGGALVFASELPALLRLLGRAPALSPVAIADYLRLGYVPHPQTIYDGVHALPPGSTLTFVPGGEPRIDRFWSPQRPEPYRGSRTEALEELDARLADAVRIRLRSDVPLGIFLSGGIDSGLVAAYAAEAGARELLCFVVSVADPALDESAAARATAGALGLPIEVIRLEFAPADAVQRVATAYGQPFADSSAIPSMYVSEAAAARRKVVLNGDGGDEIFAGYRRYWAARFAAPFGVLRPLLAPVLAGVVDAAARRHGRRSALGFAARTARGLIATPADRWPIWTSDMLADADLARCFPALYAEAAARIDTGSHTAHARGLRLMERLAASRDVPLGIHGPRQFMDTDFRVLLADDLLVKMDIATMANSLEARSPFLDVPLGEFARSLPERWLIDRRQTKPLLRALAASRLPAAVTAAPKRGFEVPVASWLRGELRPLVADTLLAADARIAAFGDRAAIHAFVDGRDAFRGNRVGAVWAMLMLELWLRAGQRAAGAPTGSALASAAP